MNLSKRLKSRIILILVLAATLLIYGISPVFAENDGARSKKVILIDPGHGGYDGGAEGKSGIKEKDVNLSISLKLKERLQAEGYEVKMIRAEDKALLDQGKRQGTKKAQDIANRCKIKQEVNADVFISIHQNHFPQGRYYGSQVWYSKNKQSHMLGKIVQDNLKKDLNHNNRRVEKPAKDSYKILSCEDSKPSILVECGFLSNPEEEQRIQSSDYQQKIADSIAKSVNEFFEKAKQLE
jgi:N-acetylmuramoyl-L-alanine amidase